MPRVKSKVSGAVMSVSDETAARLGGEWVDADASTRSEAPDSTWKVAELVDHAAENGIDLDGATKKADVLAAIVAASDSDSGSDGDQGDGSGE